MDDLHAGTLLYGGNAYTWMIKSMLEPRKRLCLSQPACHRYRLMPPAVECCALHAVLSLIHITLCLSPMIALYHHRCSSFNQVHMQCLERKGRVNQ